MSGAGGPPAAWRPILAGIVLAGMIVALFRFAGPTFFFEGRTASNVHALSGALIGAGIGWAMARGFGGLRGVVLGAIPALLLLAAVTSHFGLAFPNLDPRLDKAFGGLMLWVFGFYLLGGVLPRRGATRDTR